MTWTQVYAPLGNTYASAILAAAPVMVLLALLAWGHLRAYQAAICGLVLAFLLVLLAYRMPWPLAAMAALTGMAYGLFPLGWIILSAMFLYDVAVRSGTFETVKLSIAGLADDRRIQVVLVAFCFSAFLEGVAGFGTPVAISAAMLIGLGFPPVAAAGAALIGNTVPVPFAALGTPLVALANVTGIPLQSLSAMVGRQMPLLALVVPFCLVWAMGGWRPMLEVWPVCLVAGLSFGAVQYLVSNLHGPWLVDVFSSGASLLAVLALMRVWRPRRRWDFPPDRQLVLRTLVPVKPEPVLPTRISQAQTTGGASSALPIWAAQPTSERAVWRAWMPWLMLLAAAFTWGLPSVRSGMDQVATLRVSVPLLDGAVTRVPPVVSLPQAEPAVLVFNFLSATGTCIFLTAVAAGLLLGLGPATLLQVLGGTVQRVRHSLLTICAMLALGYLTRYGGLDASMGLALAAAGPLFPFFSPLLGGLGAALTGSVTSSNVLFGNLQQITAARLGFPAVLAAASNSTGGVLGKMLDAQSLVVASMATHELGNEGAILRYVFATGMLLAFIVGSLVMAQAYLAPGMVP